MKNKLLNKALSQNTLSHNKLDEKNQYIISGKS